jgi:lysophospholipase L1-like esterase
MPASPATPRWICSGAWIPVPAPDVLDLTALLADGAGLRCSLGVDGLHLGPAGYSLWLEWLRPML